MSATIAFQELPRNRSGLDKEETMRELLTIRRALGSRSAGRASELRALAITRGDTRAVRGARRQRRRSSKIAELPAAGTRATWLVE
jgi:hypothetical protein